ncbi:MAG: terminase small subunit-like protein [Thermoplasmataceae archaeon]
MARLNRVTKAACDRILKNVSSGQTLTAACREEGLPLTTVYNWLTKNDPEGRARAQEIGTHAMVDEGLKSAYAALPEDAHAVRVKIDMIKWVAGKRLPRVYGDKIQSEVSGPDGKPLEIVAGYLVSPEKAKDIAEWQQLAEESQKALQEG